MYCTQAEQIAASGMDHQVSLDVKELVGAEQHLAQMRQGAALSYIGGPVRVTTGVFLQQSRSRGRFVAPAPTGRRE